MVFSPPLFGAGCQTARGYCGRGPDHERTAGGVNEEDSGLGGGHADIETLTKLSPHTTRRRGTFLLPRLHSS